MTLLLIIIIGSIVCIFALLCAIIDITTQPKKCPCGKGVWIETCYDSEFVIHNKCSNCGNYIHLWI